LLVDGCSKWRDEIDLRAQVEGNLCNRFAVPHVTLVVGGGLGTLETVLASLSTGAQVILVRESGGAAQALCEYVEPFLYAAAVDGADDDTKNGGFHGDGSGHGLSEQQLIKCDHALPWRASSCACADHILRCTVCAALCALQAR
jgi:hypothetical protein